MPFKSDERCILFHVKCFFHSQDIWVFVLTFVYWSMSQEVKTISKWNLNIIEEKFFLENYT